MSDRPQVPRASELDPLTDTLPAGTPLVRVYPAARGPLTFNPTAAAGQFRPVRTPHGMVVPTAYFGADEETALAEGVLRGVTALERDARPRRLYRVEISDLAICPMRLTRATRMARMRGAGLTRLGLLRRHVIDGDASEYPYTAAWAQTLWGCRRRPAGISWTSHQSDSARAYMLWQPRIAHGRLEVAGAEVALDREPGLDLVRQACVAAGVDFEG